MKWIAGVLLFVSLVLAAPARAQAPDYSPFAGRWIHGQLALHVGADGSAQLTGNGADGQLYTADVQFLTVYRVSGLSIAAGVVTHDYQPPATLNGTSIYLGLYPQPAGVGFFAIDSGNWLTVCTPAAPTELFASAC